MPGIVFTILGFILLTILLKIPPGKSVEGMMGVGLGVWPGRLATPFRSVGRDVDTAVDTTLSSSDFSLLVTIGSTTAGLIRGAVGMSESRLLESDFSLLAKLGRRLERRPEAAEARLLI